MTLVYKNERESVSNKIDEFAIKDDYRILWNDMREIKAIWDEIIKLTSNCLG